MSHYSTKSGGKTCLSPTTALIMLFLCSTLYIAYYNLLCTVTLHGQEEMSDLRALIRLKEKELRCLEWSLMAQKAQEVAGAFVPENLREELEDCKAEQQVGHTPSAATRTSSF